MPKIDTDTLESRLNAALAKPAKRKTYVPIEDMMTKMIAFLSRPFVTEPRSEPNQGEKTPPRPVAAAR